MKLFPRCLTAVSALLALGFMVGCSIDSADEFYRDVAVNFSGFYAGRNGGTIVGQNTGAAITTLDLRQTGDSLEAVDNNGNIWRGSLGEVQNGSSSFELNGQTTAGTEATFSGTISSSDGGTSSSGTVSSASGTMQGTYIEPSRFSSFYAEASDIPGSIDNGGGDNNGGDVAISPTSRTLSSNGASATFTASGGDGSYSWTLSTTNGTLNTVVGTSIVYTRTSAGNNTITLTSAGQTAQATISQP